MSRSHNLKSDWMDERVNNQDTPLNLTYTLFLIFHSLIRLSIHLSIVNPLLYEKGGWWWQKDIPLNMHVFKHLHNNSIILKEFFQAIIGADFVFLFLFLSSERVAGRRWSTKKGGLC